MRLLDLSAGSVASESVPKGLAFEPSPPSLPALTKRPQASTTAPGAELGVQAASSLISGVAESLPVSPVSPVLSPVLLPIPPVLLPVGTSLHCCPSHSKPPQPTASVAATDVPTSAASPAVLNDQ